MFGKKKKTHTKQQPYNPQKQTPTIRASICTGEKFEEAVFIRSEKDLEEFCIQYAVRREDIKKIW